jgi:uncharacterized membrane protein
MDIIHLIIVLAVLGFALWLLLTYVPMPDPIKKVIIAIVVLALILVVLDFGGIGTGLSLGHHVGPCG